MGDHVSLGKVSTAIGIVAALLASVFFLEDRYVQRAEASDQKAELEQKIEQNAAAAQQAVADTSSRIARNQEIGQLESLVKLYTLELDFLLDKTPRTEREQRKIDYLTSAIKTSEERLAILRSPNAASR